MSYWNSRRQMRIGSLEAMTRSSPLSELGDRDLIQEWTEADEAIREGRDIEQHDHLTQRMAEIEDEWERRDAGSIAAAAACEEGDLPTLVAGDLTSFQVAEITGMSLCTARRRIRMKEPTERLLHVGPLPRRVAARGAAKPKRRTIPKNRLYAIAAAAEALFDKDMDKRVTAWIRLRKVMTDAGYDLIEK